MNLNIKAQSFTWITLTLAVFSLAVTTSGQVKAVETDKTIVIKNGDKPILTYQKAVMPPPKGADPAYARSGFEGQPGSGPIIIRA